MRQMISSYLIDFENISNINSVEIMFSLSASTFFFLLELST